MSPNHCTVSFLRRPLLKNVDTSMVFFGFPFGFPEGPPAGGGSKKAKSILKLFVGGEGGLELCCGVMGASGRGTERNSRKKKHLSNDLHKTQRAEAGGSLAEELSEGTVCGNAAFP